MEPSHAARKNSLLSVQVVVQDTVHTTEHVGNDVP